VVPISCNLLPGPRLREQAVLAENLGYQCVYIADSPALYGDVWVSVARVAEATTTVGIGTGVLVPFTRHPVVTAAAIATIESIAPGRLTLGVGAGNTARRCLGEPKPSRQAWMLAYLQVVRALLRGETTVWEGKRVGLLPPRGYMPEFPLEVPILLNAIGPRGLETARTVADGILTTVPRNDFPRCVLLTYGTVLGPDETLQTSKRAQLAHAPMVLTGVHNMYEDAPAQLDHVPGGTRWRDRMDRMGARTDPHLIVHRGHCAQVEEQDLDLLTPEFFEWSTSFTITGTAEEVGASVTRFADAGATEVLYLPAGPDVPRELEAFAQAVRAYRPGAADDT
jgi:5,10-methylenetetrahydromethanopterin reductase